MIHPLLKRRPHQDKQNQPVLDGIGLALNRVHEVCGPARRSFAMMIAARTQGPVFWVCPRWEIDRLNPQGMTEFIDPGRFVFVDAPRADDVLWVMEECLRSGGVPLVMADMTAPPALTPVRRLQLAAEAGASQGNGAVLGVLLTPEDGGAPGVESRWCMSPSHGHDLREWTLSRTRARTAPPQDWKVLVTPEGLRAAPRTERAE